MKIAVTTASGQLGSEIVKATSALTGADHVIGLARTPSKAKHRGVAVRPGDYNDREQLTESLQGIDTVLLVSRMDQPSKRIGQHRNVTEAPKAAGARKLVYTSVQGAEEGNAFSPVIQSNRQTEADVRGSGLQWVIGRNGIFNCAGEGKANNPSDFATAAGREHQSWDEYFGDLKASALIARSPSSVSARRSQKPALADEHNPS